MRNADTTVGQTADAAKGAATALFVARSLVGRAGPRNLNFDNQAFSSCEAKFISHCSSQSLAGLMPRNRSARTTSWGLAGEATRLA